MICACCRICCGAWSTYPFEEGGIVCPCGAGAIALDEVNDHLPSWRRWSTLVSLALVWDVIID